MNNNLLFRNTFINPSVSNFKTNQNRQNINEKYRKKFEEKNKINNKNSFKDLNDLMQTNPLSEKLSYDNENILRNTLSSNNGENRFFRTKSSLVSIDSRDRDHSIYPYSNNYKIFLNKQFTNVKSIRLRSTEILNSESLIRDTPVSRINNKIYWKDYGDDTIYIATIPSGNYTPSDLQNTIQTSMNNIRDSDGDFHNFSVSIDIVSNQVNFTLIKQTQLANPFTTIAGSSIVIVNQTNHGFVTGQVIFISNANLYGVLESVLNTRHIITVIDSNNYSIDLQVIIPFSTSTPKGGKEVYVGTGRNFSLLWSNTDSVGSILGFNNEDTDFGNIISNTQIKNTYNIEKIVHLDSLYSIIILQNPLDGTLNAGDYIYITGITGSGNDLLINDPGGFIISNVTNIDGSTSGITIDEQKRAFKFPIPVFTTSSSGLITTKMTYKPVKLSGENYMFMCCKEFDSTISSGDVKNIFAKIQLNSPAGSILFNTYHSAGIDFLSPLPFLSEMTFSFRTFDNHLFDFVGTDHSFTLEIIEQIHELTNDVNINSRLGFRDQT